MGLLASAQTDGGGALCGATLVRRGTSVAIARSSMEFAVGDSRGAMLHERPDGTLVPRLLAPPRMNLTGSLGCAGISLRSRAEFQFLRPHGGSRCARR